MSETRFGLEQAGRNFPTAHVSALRVSIQILLDEVKATLPESEKGKLLATSTGISGEVRYGLRPGYLTSGLSKAFINYRDTMARVTEVI